MTPRTRDRGDIRLVKRFYARRPYPAAIIGTITSSSPGHGRRICCKAQTSEPGHPTIRGAAVCGIWHPLRRRPVSSASKGSSASAARTCSRNGFSQVTAGPRLAFLGPFVASSLRRSLRRLAAARCLHDRASQYMPPPCRLQASLRSCSRPESVRMTAFGRSAADAASIASLHAERTLVDSSQIPDENRNAVMPGAGMGGGMY